MAVLSNGDQRATSNNVQREESEIDVKEAKIVTTSEKSVRQGPPNEVQKLMMDQVDAKINDMEDLKAQYAIYDRHIKKHSNESNSSQPVHQINQWNEIQESVQEQEDILADFKNDLLIASDANLNSTFVREANMLLDQSERLLESGFDLIETIVDEHVASDEHKREHEHGHGDDHSHHHRDSYADYADLVPMDFEVELEKQEMIVDFIDQEVYDIAKIMDDKSKLEKHILTHQHEGHMSEDDGNGLHLDVASSVLKELSTDELTSHEMSLLDLKKQIKASEGKMSLKDVDKVANLMLGAEDLIKSSQDKLQIVELLDEEFEENDVGQQVSMIDDNLSTTIKPSSVDDKESIDAMNSVLFPELSEVKSSLQDNVDISHNSALDDGHFARSEALDKDFDNFKSISMDDYDPNIKNAFADAAAKSLNFLHSKKIAHESHKEDDVQV